MDAHVFMLRFAAVWLFAMRCFAKQNFTSVTLACPAKNSAGAHPKHKIIEMVLY